MRRTSPFADEVVEEGAWEIDERLIDRSVCLDPPFVLRFDAAEREGVECVRRALEQLGGEVASGTDPVFDKDDEGEVTLVDKEMKAQSLRVLLLLMLSFVRNLLSETVLEALVSSSQLPLC